MNPLVIVGVSVVVAAAGFVGGILVGRRNSQHVELAVAEVKAVAAKAIADVQAVVATIKAKV